jgi:hypothetical protein
MLACFMLSSNAASDGDGLGRRGTSRKKHRRVQADGQTGLPTTAKLGNMPRSTIQKRERQL